MTESDVVEEAATAFWRALHGRGTTSEDEAFDTLLATVREDERANIEALEAALRGLEPLLGAVKEGRGLLSWLYLRNAAAIAAADAALEAL